MKYFLWVAALISLIGGHWLIAALFTLGAVFYPLIEKILKRQTKPAIEQAAVVEPQAGALPWANDVKNWTLTHLDDKGLTALDLAAYQKHLFKHFLLLRSQVLSDAEFLPIARGTAWSLFLRTQLLIVGSDQKISPEDVLIAMFAVMPDYPSFCGLKEALYGTIPIQQVGKMQMVEGEMYAFMVTYLSGDADWSANAIKKAQVSATEYWTNNAKPQYQ